MSSATSAPRTAPLQGLYKIDCVKNPQWKPIGLKSLCNLVRKYEITPTMPCPFTIVHTLIADGTSHLFKNAKPPSMHTTHQKTVARMAQKSKGTGYVAAEDVQNDSEYLAHVSIGTPGQCLSLDFDTGRQAGHTIFDPSKSSTWCSRSCQSWQIQYGDNSTASGTVGTDIISVGGLNVHGQAVELAKTLSESFVKSQGDGLFGLAFGCLNTVQPKPVQTPVENMINQSDIPKDSELFTAHLTNSKDKDPCCYTFGYIDQDLVKNCPVHYTSIDNSQGFWQVKSASVSVNEQVFQNAGNTAIIDTGTTLSLIDDTTCQNIYAAIPGAKYDAGQAGWIFPANAQIPAVKFAIGDQMLWLHGEDIAFADAGNGMVYGGIQSRGNMTFSIYGGTHLKAMYAIFDQGKNRFGFVQKPDLQAR